MSPIYFVVIFLFITIRQTTAKSSPVLIYGVKLPLRDVFPTITTKEFKEMMELFVSRYTFFVKLEPNFQARQISCQGETLKHCNSDFPESKEFTFYGSVDNPLAALKELFKETVAHDVNGEGKLTTTEYCGYKSKLNILRTSGSLTTKLTPLSFRSEIMRDISEKLKNCDLTPLFFFASDTDGDIKYEIDGDISTLQVKDVSTTIVNGVIIVDLATLKHKMFQSTDSEVKSLTLKIVKKPGKYTLVNATYDGEEYKGRKLKWPAIFTTDAPELVFARANKRLRINKLKLERFSEVEKGNTGLEYGDDWYTCVYVTPGILMGLFVVAILGTFTYWGITMLLDIQTNDRFDGPEMMALQFTNIEN